MELGWVGVEMELGVELELGNKLVRFIYPIFIYETEMLQVTNLTCIINLKLLVGIKNSKILLVGRKS